MNKQAAINLVQTTFERPYNRDRFLTFAKNIFHSFEEAPFIYRGNYIPDAYKKQIKTLERIGKYEDSEGNKIDILTVCVSQGTTLERARTLQRNFISWYLNGSRGDVTKDAALVAFYVEGSNDWRLSLVKMEYRLDKSESGRLKTFTELTPAKRFSFFVGEGENTHTAQRQLLPVLLREDTPPTLSDLEKAFSVEVVTKEFFEKYKQLFLDTKEALDTIVKADPQIQSDFQDKNIDTVDFTKKLLGQIVFLYFLQKKGWFGVSRDDNWGTGPREFLRLLFEKNITDYDNYFNDILEPLFYEALAIERPDDFYSRFDCKIPFLNGGLFDPLNNYDWVHTDIRLPNYLFSNDKPTKEGDKGTGILDVFDRYNFTVKEDEPLEKEVAVDPEMLGKVFENLLEVKDRKSKGTYYTPREIVHYMCQESLVNYLVTELDGKVSKEDIETLVQIGEAAVEHDTQVTKLGEETETYSYKLPANVRQHAKDIDEALVNIRVCDPAVGSGAFLVGMMTEIIRVRNTISAYLVDGDRSIYTFKHHAIQNSLYGVDIDPGATEIAKLRLWLSLIVDEQDIKRIKPLPNLDYKIMQGNSLLEEYEGIKLFDEELFTKSAFDNSSQIAGIKEKMSELQRQFFELHSKGEYRSTKMQQIEAELKMYSNTLKKMTQPPKIKAENASLFDQASEAKQKADELKRLQREFFNTAHKNDKDRIKKQIETLTWEFIEATLREQGKESLMTQIEKFRKTNVKPFFIWKLNFSEVFESKGGFDVVIGNPPYVKVQNLDNQSVQIYKKIYSSAVGKFDLYVLFIERLFSLMNKRGLGVYIQPHRFLTADYGKGIRKFLFESHGIKQFINFGVEQIFETGTSYTGIFFYSTNSSRVMYAFVDEPDLRGIEFIETTYDLLEDTDIWNFPSNKYQSAILAKIYKQPNSLESLSEGIYQGIVTVGDDIFIMQGEIKDGFFYGYSKSLEGRVQIEADLMKPTLKGENIRRYLPLSSSIFVFFPHYLDADGNTKPFEETELKEKYPLGYEYISRFKAELRVKKVKYKTNPKYWYSLHRARDMKIFEQSKLLTPQLQNFPNFTLDTNGFYPDAGGYSIVLKGATPEKYKGLLAILNSKLLWFFIKSTSTPFNNNYYYFKTNYLKNFKLPYFSEEINSKLVSLVDNVMGTGFSTSEDKHSSEKLIDSLVYRLYDLTPEEIAIIENEI